MLKTVPILLAVFVLLIVALACVTPAVTAPDPNLINTAIAQTYAVAASQTAEFLIPVTGPESPTPTRAASPTPFPTFTLVVLATPEIRVSVDTNCRIGPGNVYAVAGVLQADEVAQVVGRSADGNHWTIRNPDRPGEVCWISDQDATITGFTNLLPVFTPPPTPTLTRTRIPVLFTSTPTRTRTPVPTSPPARTPTWTSTPPPIPTVSSTPSATPTSISSVSPTVSSTFTFTPTSPSSPSPTASSISTTTPSATPTDLSSPSPTPTGTSTPSQTPTASPTPSQTPTASSTPSQTPTPTVTGTLTPGFTASYSGLESCTGIGWWVDLEFENTGGLAFESMIMVLSDTVTGTVLPHNSEVFTDRDGCSASDTQPNLPPGDTRIVSLPAFTYDPTGHELRSTIILCSSAGQRGTCIAQVINFTP